jgi:Protein of unknown function (DUF3752)
LHAIDVTDSASRTNTVMLCVVDIPMSTLIATQIRIEKKQRDLIEAECKAKTQEAAGIPISNKRNRRDNAGADSKSNFTWNRDEDFESHRKMTPQAYKEFVMKAKDLDSKFSKSVTKNFM